MLSQIVLVTLGVVLALFARKSRPAHDQSGSSLNNQSAAKQSPDLLRVATYNIQTGKSLHGKRNLSRSAEVLKHCDLAGVQEVYAPKLLNLFGIGRGQATRVASIGSFAWLFCPTRRRWLREHRGNLLLSKIPVVKWEIKMLPDQSGRSYRNMLIAEMQLQGQTFHFINTHLHTRQGREEQLDIVLREFAKYPRAILLGDFNSRIDSPMIARALKNVEISDAIALAELDLDNPDRIDWIFTKGFNVQGGEMIEKGISDHPYYQVDLSIRRGEDS
jgi:endonuclease/exonuclease/phosphatase family metal-dependent hydrolase